jgi:hypothetical protein
MATYRGSCHCGRVTFEVDADITALSQCNCSMCARKGALYVPVREIAAVRILSGEAELSAYQFNTRTATHYFCRHCGIQPFHRPRLDPARWSVNARCLDDFERLQTLPIRRFDGQHWEESAARERERHR